MVFLPRGERGGGRLALMWSRTGSRCAHVAAAASCRRLPDDSACLAPVCSFFKTLLLKFSCILQTCFSVSWFHNPEGLKTLGDLQAERVLSLSEEFLVEIFHFICEEPLPVNPPRRSWPCPVSPLITVETSSLCRKTLTWSSILLLLFLTQFQTVLSPLFGSTCKQNNSLVPFFSLRGS